MKPERSAKEVVEHVRNTRRLTRRLLQAANGIKALQKSGASEALLKLANEELFGPIMREYMNEEVATTG